MKPPTVRGMGCKTIAVLFIICLAAWIIVAYVIGLLIGAW